MPHGYLAIVLHAHLPFVRHPEASSFMEEEWFFEAITETYTPLLLAFERLARDDVDFRLTLSFSPSLLSMMTDDLLKERYARKLDSLVELADKEVDRTWREDRAFHELAKMYRHRFGEIRDCWRRYDGDLGRGVPRPAGRRAPRDHHVHRDAPVLPAARPQLGGVPRAGPHGGAASTSASSAAARRGCGSASAATCRGSTS